MAAVTVGSGAKTEGSRIPGESSPRIIPDEGGCVQKTAGCGPQAHSEIPNFENNITSHGKSCRQREKNLWHWKMLSITGSRSHPSGDKDLSPGLRHVHS